MAIGAATEVMPRPGMPPPKPLVYTPPAFTACVARLQGEHTPTSAISSVTTNCRRKYEGIQKRILNFLISGYWLRGEATHQGMTVTEAEIRKKFEEEERAAFPNRASLRKLEAVTRQTASDLTFAVGTQMLSTKLLEHFAKRHPRGKSEAATVAAFNTSIRSTWTPRTSCAPGYIVPDCKQYRPPKGTAK
jgi:hypothetical protein